MAAMIANIYCVLTVFVSILMQQPCEVGTIIFILLMGETEAR